MKNTCGRRMVTGRRPKVLLLFKHFFWQYNTAPTGIHVHFNLGDFAADSFQFFKAFQHICFVVVRQKKKRKRKLTVQAVQWREKTRGTRWPLDQYNDVNSVVYWWNCNKEEFLSFAVYLARLAVWVNHKLIFFWGKAMASVPPHQKNCWETQQQTNVPDNYNTITLLPQHSTREQFTYCSQHQH